MLISYGNSTSFQHDLRTYNSYVRLGNELPTGPRRVHIHYTACNDTQLVHDRAMMNGPNASLSREFETPNLRRQASHPRGLATVISMRIRATNRSRRFLVCATPHPGEKRGAAARKSSRSMFMLNGPEMFPPDHDLESSPRRRSGSSYLKGILDHAPQLAWKSEVPLSSVPDSGRLLCGEELPRVVPASRGRYRNRL
jgi:hypothetical protein